MDVQVDMRTQLYRGFQNKVSELHRQGSSNTLQTDQSGLKTRDQDN